MKKINILIVLIKTHKFYSTKEMGRKAKRCRNLINELTGLFVEKELLCILFNLLNTKQPNISVPKRPPGLKNEREHSTFSRQNHYLSDCDCEERRRIKPCHSCDSERRTLKKNRRRMRQPNIPLYEHANQILTIMLMRAGSPAEFMINDVKVRVTISNKVTTAQLTLDNITLEISRNGHWPIISTRYASNRKVLLHIYGKIYG
jgi:hypothetical protein